MKSIAFGKKWFWIAWIGFPISNTCGQSTNAIKAAEDSIRAEFQRNARAIHKDLIRGDFARAHVLSLENQLTFMREDSARQAGNLNQTVGQKQALSNQLAKQGQQLKAARTEIWIWRGAAVLLLLKLTRVL